MAKNILPEDGELTGCSSSVVIILAVIIAGAWFAL